MKLDLDVSGVGASRLSSTRERMTAALMRRRSDMRDVSAGLRAINGAATMPAIPPIKPEPLRGEP
ncbi:MAG: hypothetical protein K2X41_11755 [Hyphomicrobium sp.]|nr:hypothetical protein [Hyphomicrobium sp.]